MYSGLPTVPQNMREGVGDMPLVVDQLSHAMPWRSGVGGRGRLVKQACGG
jgi:hypothetical protein